MSPTITPRNRFHAYAVALELVRSVSPLVEAIRRRDADLARQISRALASIPLNVAEGNRRLGRDRRHLFSVAAGSNDEVRAALDVAAARGFVSERRIAAALELADREAAMLYRLTH